MEEEDSVMETEGFANIDDLLEDVEEEKGPLEVALDDTNTSISIDQGEDGFENDRPDTDLNLCILKNVPKTENAEAHHEPETSDKDNVFSSSFLNDVLGQNMDAAKTDMFPINLAMQGISDVDENERNLIDRLLEERDTLEGLRAGLGQQKKSRMKMRMKMIGMGTSATLQSSKAKTLAMKRVKLQQDIMKYGVAAIERLYPRQQKQNQLTRRKSTGSKRETQKFSYKMKPAPHDVHFEEVDAKNILKPFSHHKYIKEPKPGVVFINRKDGLVPLSTLCKESRTLLPTSPRLLAGRNLTMGKPGHYVKQGGRLVAVGGTRNKTNSTIKIVKVPSFERETNKMPLFTVDTEMANFACSAVRPRSGGRRVDIRQLKKIRNREKEIVKKKISEEKSYLDKMIIKLNYNRNEDDEFGVKTEFNERMDSFKKAKNVKIEEKSDADVTEDCPVEYKSFNIGLMDYQKNLDLSEDNDIPEQETSGSCQNQEVKCENKEVTKIESEEFADEEDTKAKILVVKNSWANTPKNVVPEELNMDECPPLRGYSESSIRPPMRTPILNFDGYTGFDTCDILDCFCKEGLVEKGKNETGTELGTPLTTSHSGSQTPSGSMMRKGPQRIAKDLLRVKRALKTLGVKIIEFDDHEGSDDCCTKDYCKFGCICDSLRTKQIPPSHCGKVDCMFTCCCSKEALKYSSCGSRRVNISAAVGARIQEDSQRNMAVEERKFSNTVVVTSDKDAVMLGGRTGRGTRRERKLPQRYQNANTLMLDVAGKEYVEKEVSSESDVEYEDEKIVDVFSDLKRAGDILPCTVVIPKVSLPASCSVWCMFHCQYSCPCYKFRDPLDFGPDRNASRNVARRTIGNKFTSKAKKRLVSGEKKKTTSTKEEDDAPLLGIEDIDPDFSKTVSDDETTSTAKNVSETVETKKNDTKRPRRSIACARTRKTNIKQSAGLKLPYIPKAKNKKSDSISAHLPDMEEVICVSDPPSVARISEEKKGFEKDPNSEFSVATEINLNIEPKFSRQYVRWDLFKQQFAVKEQIDLWYWVRPSRGKDMVFVTRRDTKPYLATAINMRNLQGRTSNLPGLVSECLKPGQDRDKKMYVVLESNGTVWCLVSILANRKSVGEEDIKNLTLDSRAVTPTPNRVKVKDGSAKVSLGEMVQKLPVGQSLITVTENGKAVMQVKLPPTLATQYWSLISVGQGQSSIQCPDSSLVLKCAILQQAATLATATSTTVRIPIPVADEDQSFGVYAVPGLKTHVFVGPFKTEEAVNVADDDDEDIVCLDDDVSKSDSDDIKILKEEELDKIKKKNSIKKIINQTKMMGQTPQVVAKDESDDDEIDIIQEIPCAKTAAKEVKKDLVKSVEEMVPPVDITRASDQGKIVIRPNGNSLNSGTAITVRFSKINGEDDTFKAIMASNGKVSFPHPKVVDHAVICPSVPAAKLWLENYFEEIVENPEEETIFDKIPEVAARPKTPPPVLKLIKTPSLPSGKSTDHISLFLQTKEQKDEAALFYELGHTAFTHFFQRNISRAQILVKAKEEIHSLEEEGVELETTKATLLKKRTKLFDDFTKSLNGLPVAKKKAAVMELKELLKKNKENSEGVRPRESTVTNKGSTDAVASQPMVVSSSSAPTPYTDLTGINTVRSDGSILRPMNAFMLWAKEKRVEMMGQGLQMGEVSQALSEQWKNLSEEERARYYMEQEHLKELHKIQHPDYKYSPKISRSSGSHRTSQTATTHLLPQMVPTGHHHPASPPPVSPNQPPEVIEEEPTESNQPSQHFPPAIQVPRPLSQLRNQSIIVSKPRTPSRPTPGLIPVQTYSKVNYGLVSSTPTLLTPKPATTTTFTKPILNIPSRPSVKMANTFSLKMSSDVSSLPRVSGLQQEEQEDIPVLSLPEPQDGMAQSGLDLMDLPQDAADMLGLAVQSSGVETPRWEGGQESGQQYIIQGENINARMPGQHQKFIQIGGDNYALVGDSDGGHMLMEQSQQLLLNQQDPSPQIVYHQEQQMMMQEQQQQPQQQILLERSQQMLVDQDQPVYVDEMGRQLLLSPEQQLMIQQQQLGGQQLQLVHGDQGDQQVLLAYQDPEQDQQVVYQDQDVMTID